LKNGKPTQIILSGKFSGIFLGGKGGRWLGPTNLTPSCVDCLEMSEPQNPGTFWACNRPVQIQLDPYLYLTCREQPFLVVVQF